MKVITKIVLSNFKRFRSFELDFDSKLNILVGDNEAGKSTVLLAVDLILSGSRTRVETQGLESLFNKSAVDAFLAGDRSVANLPKLFAEVYLSEQNSPALCGKNNSMGINCDGIRLDCEPIDDYGVEILAALQDEHAHVPFEYYSIKFMTFSGEQFSGFRRPLRHLFIDSSQINQDYATREYTRSVYAATATLRERSTHDYLYRQSKLAFAQSALLEVNNKLPSYKFAVRSGAKAGLDTDLLITEDDIPIERKGKGRQCFIKTEFALQKNSGEHSIDVLLLEEPENHLSHTNTRKLVQRISESEQKQVIIATHSSLICSRLDLRKTILLHRASARPAPLTSLPEDTAKFFMKAPDNNVLEFVLADKVVLVEGDSEFILFDAMYRAHAGATTPEHDGVQIISVGGLAFKRYMDIAKLLGIKTAVLRDNDRDRQTNCIERYSDYTADHIAVFSDSDDTRYTFEVCLYKDNQAVCDELFLGDRKKLTVQEYMLGNKADAAFLLLDKKGSDLVAPAHIQDAIAWIRK